MINNSIKLLLNTYLFKSFKYVHTDILNLPNEIKASKQFCLWRYQHLKNSDKFVKMPYGYSKEGRSLIPSLKNQNYWLTFNEFLDLTELLPNHFKLGLVLTNSPFTVIDIDNYQRYAPLDKLLYSMLKKGAYIEISPSGKGIHIFFIGLWHYKKNKGDKQIVIEGSNIKTSCEIYTGKDVRFMTLTGSRLFDPSAVSIPLATLSCVCEELQALERIFFNALQALNSSPSILAKSRNQFIDNDIGSESNLDAHFSRIKNDILSSDHAEEFVRLCNNLNPGYQSASEADWRFCSIVSNFINPRWLYQDQAQILGYIFVNARKNRDKNHRADYLQKTIKKVLMARNNSNIISNSFAEKRSLNQNNLNPRIISSSKKKKCEVDKNAIIKICNTMKIFHLGRSIKNFEYCNDAENNYLKATIPNSLNHIDLRYYIQLLFQYLDEVEQLTDIKLAQTEFLPININLILKNSNNSTGGKSYNHFKASLNKLSDVTLVYNKKITSDGLYHAHKESLLSYKILHQHFRQGVTANYSTQWRKLAVKMHPIILDISKEATYNYSLFNKNSYSSLSSDKIKLLYYHACCLTFPGGHTVKLSLDNLLSLWPPTNLRQVKQKRKQEMIQLLQDFAALESKLDDLDVSLIYIKHEIVGINIKKRKLKLV